jgi:hypothetical protein
MGDRNYIFIPAGTPCSSLDEDTTLLKPFQGFAEISRYHDDMYGFEKWSSKPDATHKTWYSIEAKYAMVLPVHIRFAQEQLESGVVRRIKEQRLQQTILNPPRNQVGPNKDYDLVDYNFYMEAYPNICWGLQWGAGLGGSETGCCLRDYARGYQFSCEAVSHAGGTPLDALVRSMHSVAALVSGRSDLGDEIAYTVLDGRSAMINLAMLERWMTFLRHEYELKEGR